MNGELHSEIEGKIQRVRDYLDRTGYDGFLIGRKDNFAWLTCGGTSEVVIRSEYGAGVLVISPRRVQLIAHPMDGPRILEEELGGISVDYVQVEWHESTLLEKAAELAAGKRFASDLWVDGVDYLPEALTSLHYPLTGLELNRLRSLGATTESVLRSVADHAMPGMSEREVAGMLEAEYARLGIACDVVLVGSDERVSRYRHPVPTDKRIERFLLLHSAVQQHGLHANVTRLVSFGKVSEEVQARYDAASRVEATAISMCVPGTRFRDILAAEKQALSDQGYPDDWRFHFLGGTTGYIVADPSLCLEPNAVVSANQAYDWFITITGVKVEELSVNSGGRPAVYSVTGRWPTKNFGIHSRSFELPLILAK